MRLYAIYGNPVAHSKSPRIHNAAFRTFGLRDHAYTRFLLEEGSGLVEHFRRMGLSGANVTVPFKEDMLFGDQYKKIAFLHFIFPCVFCAQVCF